MKRKHVVGLILDPFFGIKILDLAVNFHCWVIESEVNNKYKEDVWRKIEKISDPLEAGITMFEASTANLEEECLQIIEAIIDHHNEFQHDPGINCLKVYGIYLTKNLKKEIKDFGFVEFQETCEGFWAIMV